MNDGYSALAAVYDSLNGADYDALLSFVVSRLEKENITPPSLLLDLGCGTGVLTRMLSERGYDMIGIDSNPDMLSEARESDEGGGVLWLCQSATDFELYGTVAGIVCSFDVINHIHPRDLDKVFSLVANYLDDGGVFIFDVCEKEKFTFDALCPAFDDGEEASCVMCCDFDGKEAKYSITVFERDGDVYYRSDGEVSEYYHTPETLAGLLEKNSLTVKDKTASFTDREIAEYRSCYLCKREKRGQR